MRRLVVALACLLALAAVGGGRHWRRNQQAAARRLANWQAEREEDTVPAALSQEFVWQRAGLTLAQFADLVAATSSVEVELDRAGIAADRRLSKLDDMQIQVPDGRFSLDVLLRMVLAPKRLTAILVGRKVVITTPANSNAPSRLRTVVYPLPQPELQGLNESDWAHILAANIDGHVEAIPGAMIVVANPAAQRRARLVIDTVCSLKEAKPDPVAIPPAPLTAGERRILAALDQPCSLDVVEMPLQDVVWYLVDQYGIPLILMADKLEEVGISLDTPNTKSLRDISLRSVLRLLLKDMELTYFVRDEAVVITTPEDAESQLQTFAYPIHDLAGTPKGPIDADLLCELLVACVAPASWGDFSGPGPIHHVGDGWLVFEQTDYGHEQVAGLFAAMRRILASKEHVETQPITPWTDTDRKIRAALDRPIAIDFKNTPLKDCVSYLHKTLNIPIVLSTKKLDEWSVSTDTPVTLRLPTARARHSLEHLLKDLELDFAIRDEVLQITTPEDVESQLDTRVYDTRRLIAERIPAAELRKQIEKTVQPRSWDDVGGPGHVDVYRNLLVVSHTERVHEEIENLLAAFADTPIDPKQPPAPVEKH